ncbi:MAG: ABC transporter permease [Hespellia sp.]|nr:ABC transporter permease [Hespellia sp.]
MKAIFKRELQSYFTSMIGCVFIAVVVAFTGIYFLAYNLNGGYPYFAYALGGALIVFLVAIPILTMRSFSEDRKNKTDQLLLTSPVSVTKVVLGKFFAMAVMFLIPNIIFLFFPWIIKMQGTAYIGADYLSILVFFLLGCVYISIGMFISALTESQIIACISTFGILLILYLWNGIISFLPSSAVGNAIGLIIILTAIVVFIFHMTGNFIISAAIEAIGVIATAAVCIVKSSLLENLLSTWLGKLALTDIFSGVADNSIFDVSGLVLYLSIIVLFVFLTIQAIQKRRWS